VLPEAVNRDTRAYPVVTLFWVTATV